MCLKTNADIYIQATNLSLQINHMVVSSGIVCGQQKEISSQPLLETRQ